jgi:Neuraminidase (sialidase)
MNAKKKREWILTGLIVPWVITLIAVFFARSSMSSKDQALQQVETANASKVASDRQLADYIDNRERFRRDCEQLLEQGKKRLEEATTKHDRAELALLNTTQLLRKFGYSPDQIRSFQTLATDDKRLSSLIAEKANRHLPGDSRPRNGNLVRDSISNRNSKASLTMINGSG